MITYRRLGKLGGWGNQLFQYTATRLYANLNNYYCSFPKWLGNKFFVDSKVYNWYEKLFSYFLPVFSVPLYSKNKLKTLYKNPKDNLCFDGYLQDKYNRYLLKKHKDKVLNWLKFRKEIEMPVISLKKKYGPWIGVHIRRGDFPKEKWISTKRYKKFLKRKAKNKKICICTDDPKVKLEFNDFEVLDLKNKNECLPNYIFDFLILKHANLIFGGGSTFCWWAAYLRENGSYYSPPLSHLWEKAEQVKFEKRDI